MKKYLYFLFPAISLLSFLGSYGFVFALEVQYPKIGGSEALGASTTLPKYFKYIFDLGMGLGILLAIASLAVGGVLYVLSSAQPRWKAIAMDRISGAITGFILLLFTYLIITTINPQLSIFRFNFNAESPKPPAPAKIVQPGIYLYSEKDCKVEGDPVEDTTRPFTTSISDLGNFKYSLRSGKITHDPKNNLYYVMFLHDRLHFQGGCEQIDPNKACTNINTLISSSMSIYRYNMKDDGSGVIFYRNPYFNKDGGWVRISKQLIASNKEDFSLASLTFNGDGGGCTVPTEDQDCMKWSVEGKCQETKCPSLIPENINSIDVGGKYIVFFYYSGKDPSGDNPFQWANCQIFPTPEDKDFAGPKIMKWDYVRNFGAIPDKMAIFPIVR